MAQLLMACSGCGVAMSPKTVLYNRDAMPVCDACYGKADLLDTDRRAAANIRKAGFACLAAGVVALFAPMAHIGFLVACVVLALTSGVFALQSLARGNERFTKHLTPLQRQIAWASSVAGLALSAISVMGGNFARLLPG